jgi:putative oxidoreductase
LARHSIFLVADALPVHFQGMIFRSLSKYRDTGLLLLRILIGLSFLAHGLPYLKEGPETWIKMGRAMEFMGFGTFPLIWGLMACLSESLGGFLLLIGFCFRPACFFLWITMVVATVMHFNTTPGDIYDKWVVASHAIELGSVFFSLLLIGPGKFSVDRE